MESPAEPRKESSALAPRSLGRRLRLVIRRPRFSLKIVMVLLVLLAMVFKGILVVRDKTLRLALEADFSYRNSRPKLPEPILIQALSNTDPGVRYSAVWALDTIGSTSPELVRALVQRLETETYQHILDNRRDPHQIHPVLALRRIKPPAALLAPLLRTAMASQDPFIRFKATEALRDQAQLPGHDDPVLQELLLASLQDREIMIRRHGPEALARLNPEAHRKAVAILVDQLRQPDRVGQLLAADGLARFAAEALPAVAVLCDRLREANEPRDRMRAIYLLGRLGPVALPAVPNIVNLMTFSESNVAFPLFPEEDFGLHQGGWNIYEFETDHHRTVRSGYDSSLSPDLQTVGAIALRRIGPEAERQATGRLISMLETAEPPQRPTLAVALSLCGSQTVDVFPALVAAVERAGPAPEGQEDWPPTLRLTTAMRRSIPDDDPRLSAALVHLLKSDDKDKRAAAAINLNDLRPTPSPSAIPALIEATHDKDLSVWFHVSYVLGKYEGPKAQITIPILLEFLHDESEEIRGIAMAALVHHQIESDRLIPTAIALLRSKNPYWRTQAAKILGSYGPAAKGALTALREARHDEDETVRAEVEKTLKAIQPGERETLPAEPH